MPILNFIFSDVFLTLTFYYSFTLVWLFVIYTYRNTFLTLKEIKLSYKYEPQPIFKTKKGTYVKLKTIYKNSAYILVNNALFSIITGMYMSAMGIHAYFIMVLPLVFLGLSFILMLGYFSNITNKDVHKKPTLLG